MTRSRFTLSFPASYAYAGFCLCLALAVAITGCSNIPVDPVNLPFVPPKDTTTKKAGVTISVETSLSSAQVMLGESIQLNAVTRAHKDTTATDSITKSFVLRDSSVLWSIVSGDGSITSSGLYTAPVSIPGTTSQVVIKARSNYDVNASSVVTITVRKPNLLPLSLGAYWVYEQYPLDTITMQRITSRKSIDSVLVVGSVLQGGRVTSMALTYRNGTPKDTTYYSTENGSVFAYTRISDNLGTSPMQRQWIKVLDPNASQWVAYDSTFANIPIVFNGQQGIMNGRLTMTCNRGTSDSISTATSKLSAQRYTVTITVNMMLTVNGINIPVQYTVPANEWYADNVGLVRSMSELFQVTGPFGGALRRTSEERVLLRYSLAR